MSSTGGYFNLPNLISVVRLCLLPVVYLLVTEGNRTAAFFLVVFLAGTDWADGYLARTTGQVTEAGKLLDPLADRLMVVVIVYSLYTAQLVTPVVMFAFLLREATALAGYAFFALRGVRIDVNQTGKVAATIVYIFLILSLISDTVAGMLWIAAAVYWLSLLLYLKKLK